MIAQWTRREQDCLADFNPVSGGAVNTPYRQTLLQALAQATKIKQIA